MKSDQIEYIECKYVLNKTYRVQVGILPLHPIKTRWVDLSSDGWLEIRYGFPWDGASGPTIDTPDSMRGSLVHDALYYLFRTGLLDIDFRTIADDRLRDICIEDGMEPLRANIWHEAVRGFAAKAAEGPGFKVLVAPRPYNPPRPPETGE